MDAAVGRRTEATHETGGSQPSLRRGAPAPGARAFAKANPAVRVHVDEVQLPHLQAHIGQAGGIPDVRFLDDVASVDACRWADLRVPHSPLARVQTSPRREGRAEVGASWQLRQWGERHGVAVCITASPDLALKATCVQRCQEAGGRARCTGGAVLRVLIVAHGHQHGTRPEAVAIAAKRLITASKPASPNKGSPPPGNPSVTKPSETKQGAPCPSGQSAALTSRWRTWRRRAFGCSRECRCEAVPSDKTTTSPAPRCGPNQPLQGCRRRASSMGVRHRPPLASPEKAHA